MRMRDVAKAVGVSTMTVSRALRHDTSVSPETRALIVDAVKRLGYVPDQTAGSLSSRRSGFVAALIPSLNNPHFSETAHALSDGCEAAGLRVLLGYTNYRREKEEALVEALLRRKPEAMILTNDGHSPRTRSLLKKSNIPVIEMWDIPERPLGCSVGFSNFAAMKALVVALAQKGYKRIAYLGEQDDIGTRGAARRAGYLSAIAETGQAIPRCCATVAPPATMSDGAAGLDAVRAQWPDSDALVCVSDPLAFGVIMACHARGISVPGQLAIAGFGDFEVARVSCPGITTVHIDATEVGRLTAQAALSAIEATSHGRSKQAQNVLIPFGVRFRDSA